MGQTSPAPMLLEIIRAEGVFMYGPSGEKYIDLVSGVSVSNTGHCHPQVVKAVREQTEAYMHLMVYGEMVQSPQVKYAEKLAGILPPELNMVFFVTSGSEAVEGALKLAKRFTGRSRIISFRNAYHGSTHGALSIQGREYYRNAFRPLLPDTFQIPFNDVDSLSMIDRKTACVVIEPVQSEAGVIMPENGFLQVVREKCTETGSLLVFDEIQTGFGRTGYMFAIDKFGIIPDILVLAKALGGGMPLGAFISSSRIMSVLISDPPLGHITTFGGHPVCCAAGLASLEVIIKDDLIGSVRERSELFRRELVHPLIKEIRGDGLLLAVELSDPEFASLAVSRAPDYGLLLDYFLFCPSSFRIAPPLIITDEEIIYACSCLKKLLDSIMANQIDR
jgi:acetylornithine/succinyldiaminopimelate/putrescine aminotransferase